MRSINGAYENTVSARRWKHGSVYSIIVSFWRVFVLFLDIQM